MQWLTVFDLLQHSALYAHEPFVINTSSCFIHPTSPFGDFGLLFIHLQRLNILHIHATDLGIVPVKDLGHLLQREPLGFGIEEVDEDEVARVQYLRRSGN